jgi:transcriptional regulator with XRE-family HTH domain
MKCKYCEHCKIEELITKIPKDSRKRIGTKIKYYRLLRRLSQKELGKTLGFKSATAISLIEAGQRRVSADMLVSLSIIFKVKLEQLF